MIKLLLSILLLSYVQCSFAQADTIVYYFDKAYNITVPDSAMYIGYGVQSGAKFDFYNHVFKSGILVEHSHYTDSSLAIHNGLSETFYRSGVAESKGIYKNNLPDGLWLYWDNAGNLTDSTVSENGKKLLINSWTYKVGLLESYVYGDKKNHVEGRTTYAGNGNKTLEIKTIAGSGYYKKFYPNGKLSLSRVIEKDKVKVEIMYKEDGTPMTKREVVKVEKEQDKEYERQRKERMAKLPEYSGGMEGFDNYVSRKLDYRGTTLEVDIRVKQTISFSFMLNEAGHAYDIQVFDVSNLDLQTLLKGILINMPAWKMKGYKIYGPINRSYNIH